MEVLHLTENVEKFNSALNIGESSAEANENVFRPYLLAKICWFLVAFRVNHVRSVYEVSLYNEPTSHECINGKFSLNSNSDSPNHYDKMEIGNIKNSNTPLEIAWIGRYYKDGNRLNSPWLHQCIRYLICLYHASGCACESKIECMVVSIFAVFCNAWFVRQQLQCQYK